MAAITNHTNDGFHWSPASLILSIFLGVAATMAIWFIAGILIMLFLL